MSNKNKKSPLHVKLSEVAEAIDSRSGLSFQTKDCKNFYFAPVTRIERKINNRFACTGTLYKIDGSLCFDEVQQANLIFRNDLPETEAVLLEIY